MSETDPSGKPVHIPRPDRVKASVLSVIGGADMREQTVRIEYIGDGFALHAATGVCVATCEHPVRLSEYAFNNGAWRVVHNYDLRLAE